MRRYIHAGYMQKEITPAQIQLIHSAKAQLGISDAEYRALLRLYDAVSCKDLDYESASALIDEPRRKGFRISGAPTAKRPRGVTGLITPAQVKYLSALIGQVDWRMEDGYERLCIKIIKKRRPTTSREAGRMIECLKGMLGAGLPRGRAPRNDGGGDPF